MIGPGDNGFPGPAVALVHFSPPRGRGAGATPLNTPLYSVCLLCIYLSYFWRIVIVVVDNDDDDDKMHIRRGVDTKF